MKMSLSVSAAILGVMIALTGCSKDAGSADVGGSSSISGGAGGEGAGVTGTQGDNIAPSFNPGADSPKSNGTGDN
jgi:hypothetical protein